MVNEQKSECRAVALRITRARFAAALAGGFLLCLAGVWSFFAGQGKNGFDTLSLGWYVVLVSIPLLGVACFIGMWRSKAGSGLWLVVGALLLVPQLFVWWQTVEGVLHYLFWWF